MRLVVGRGSSSSGMQVSGVQKTLCFNSGLLWRGVQTLQCPTTLQLLMRAVSLELSRFETHLHVRYASHRRGLTMEGGRKQEVHCHVSIKQVEIQDWCLCSSVHEEAWCSAPLQRLLFLCWKSSVSQTETEV